MSNRARRAATAAETLEILRSGGYTAPSGKEVRVEDAVRGTCSGSLLFTPDEAAGLQPNHAEKECSTHIEVRNETTLAGARRLVEQHGAERVALLNFASARNPGGGFLGGSQAQEESLARASGLHAALEAHPRFYDTNRATHSLLYTDHLIVSPRVPVFRDDDDKLLEEPWQVTMITSPAPNAGAVRREQPEAAAEILPTLQRRAGHVLGAALRFEQTGLVLGAWGCGVFANDPTVVAQVFRSLLLDGGPFAGRFEQIAFAVLDSKGEAISAFERAFS